MRTTFTLLAFAGMVFSINTLAANVSEDLKKANTDACLKFGTKLPSSPKDPAVIPAYCNCVSDVYWNGVPQAEYDELISTGRSKRIQENVRPRMDSSQKTCKKKLGV